MNGCLSPGVGPVMNWQLISWDWLQQLQNTSVQVQTSKFHCKLLSAVIRTLSYVVYTVQCSEDCPDLNIDETKLPRHKCVSPAVYSQAPHSVLSQIALCHARLFSTPLPPSKPAQAFCPWPQILPPPHQLDCVCTDVLHTTPITINSFCLIV